MPAHTLPNNFNVQIANGPGGHSLAFPLSFGQFPPLANAQSAPPLPRPPLQLFLTTACNCPECVAHFNRHGFTLSGVNHIVGLNGAGNANLQPGVLAATGQSVPLPLSQQLAPLSPSSAAFQPICMSPAHSLSQQLLLSPVSNQSNLADLRTPDADLPASLSPHSDISEAQIAWEEQHLRARVSTLGQILNRLGPPVVKDVERTTALVILPIPACADPEQPPDQQTLQNTNRPGTDPSQQQLPDLSSGHLSAGPAPEWTARETPSVLPSEMEIEVGRDSTAANAFLATSQLSASTSGQESTPPPPASVSDSLPTGPVSSSCQLPDVILATAAAGGELGKLANEGQLQRDHGTCKAVMDSGVNEDSFDFDFDWDQLDWELLLSESGIDGVYKTIFHGDATEVKLLDLRPGSEYFLKYFLRIYFLVL